MRPCRRAILCRNEGRRADLAAPDLGVGAGRRPLLHPRLRRDRSRAAGDSGQPECEIRAASLKNSDDRMMGPEVSIEYYFKLERRTLAGVVTRV